MACNCISNRCNRCRNFVVSSGLSLSDGLLVVTIPQNTYANNSEVCICITQSLPSGVTSDTPVAIQIGSSATLYSLTTKCGHNVYGDQIKSRRIYCTRVATDTQRFIYNGRYSLPCTNHVFPIALPITTAVPSASTK